MAKAPARGKPAARASATAGAPGLSLGIVGALIVWTAEAVLLASDQQRGIFPLFRAAAAVQRTEQEIAQLEQRRDALRTRSDALRGDPSAIEAAAREELGMVYPGEFVVSIPENELDPSRP